MERLEEEIHEIRTMREDLYSSGDERSEESDSDEDDDVDALQRKLHLLVQDNARLEVSDVTSHSPSLSWLLHRRCIAFDVQKQSTDFCTKIYQEVQDCLKIKVQIRLFQRKQLESSKNNELDLLL